MGNAAAAAAAAPTHAQQTNTLAEAQTLTAIVRWRIYAIIFLFVYLSICYKFQFIERSVDETNTFVYGLRFCATKCISQLAPSAPRGRHMNADAPNEDEKRGNRGREKRFSFSVNLCGTIRIIGVCTVSAMTAAAKWIYSWNRSHVNRWRNECVFFFLLFFLASSRNSTTLAIFLRLHPLVQLIVSHWLCAPIEINKRLIRYPNHIHRLLTMIYFVMEFLFELIERKSTDTHFFVGYVL